VRGLLTVVAGREIDEDSIMRAKAFPSTRSLLWVTAVIGAFAVAACSQEGWKMDWWNQDKQPQTKSKPVTKAQQRPATESKTAQPQTAQAPSTVKPATPEEPEDPQSREVQAKVDRYVQAMGSSPDGSRGVNDFNSKIERQQDPNRKNRVRQVAEQSREGAEPGAGERPGASRPPVDSTPKTPVAEQPRETPKTAAPANESPRNAGPVFGESEPAARADAKDGLPKSERLAVKGAPAEGETGRIEANPGDTKASEERPTKTADSSDPSARPPVLAEITVTPSAEPAVEAPKAAEETQRATPNVAAQPSAEPADTFQKRLAEQEARVGKDVNDLAEQYRLRMMYLIEGQDEKALAPAEGMDAESQQILQSQVRALIAARSSSGRDPAGRAMELLTPVEELRTQLRARADLQVPKVLLCTKIEAFGMYEPIEPSQFAAGKKNPVLVYIEVDNFKSEKTSSGLFRTLLTVRPSLLNKTGEELWSNSYDNIEDLSRQRRHDFFLTVNEVLPASLTPGEYTLKIEVEDVLAGKINSNTAKFKIVP
jgi:hypothetical protein